MPNLECMFVQRNKSCSCQRVDDIKMTGKKAEYDSHVEESDEKSRY